MDSDTDVMNSRMKAGIISDVSSGRAQSRSASDSGWLSASSLDFLSSPRFRSQSAAHCAWLAFHADLSVAVTAAGSCPPATAASRSACISDIAIRY